MTATASTVEVKSGFPRHLLPRVWRWIEPHREKLLDDYGPRDLAAFMQDWDHPTILAQCWEVTADGELAGVIRVTPSRRGISTLEAVFPQYSFKAGLIAQGIEQAIQQAFAANADCKKIEWRGFEISSTLIGVIKKIGGSKNAVIKDGALLDGQWVSVVQMGILREEVI